MRITEQGFLGADADRNEHFLSFDRAASGKHVLKAWGPEIVPNIKKALEESHWQRWQGVKFRIETADELRLILQDGAVQGLRSFQRPGQILNAPGQNPKFVFP